MTLHVLDVVNLSNGRNLDADSGLRLQREFLLHALRQRPDLFVHVLVPTQCPDWFTSGLPNRVRLLHWDIETRQRGGAFQFHPSQLAELIDLRNYEIDVIWMNHPELVNAFLFLLNRAHFLDVHSFCYVHWMDWRRWGSVRNRRNVAGNLAALSGMLGSRIVACNSKFGREMILRYARGWLSVAAFGELESRLVPLYPGIDATALSAARVAKRQDRIKTIVFPHRALRYTGFPYLIEHLKKLWKWRQDFRLVLTDPSQSKTICRLGERLPFIEILSLRRAEYVKLLWESDIVIGMHNGWNQWSLGSVEALACECMPLFTRETFFPELLENCSSEEDWPLIRERFLFYRGQFTAQLNRLLDDDGEARALASALGRKARRFYGWKERARAWIHCFDLVDQEVPRVTWRSHTAVALVKHVEVNGGCSKAELLRAKRWHTRTRQIPWSRYRKHLKGMVRDEVDQLGRTLYVPRLGVPGHHRRASGITSRRSRS